MNDGEGEDMTREKVPEWESELWSYISNGNGKHCPLLNECPSHSETGYCLDEYTECISCLLSDKQIDLRKYDCLNGIQCGRMHELVERLALWYLKKGTARYPPPVPIDLISLVDQQKNIEIRLVPLKSYHGAVWRLRDGWVIHLNANDSDNRRRFTLFHEAFHIMAHCKATPVFNSRGGAEGSFNEMMADCFASCFLMPEVWVREMWAEVKNLDRLAEIFQVPIQVVCVRLKWLGLI